MEYSLIEAKQKVHIKGSFIRCGSGESFQLEVVGQGSVLVQPYKEVKYTQK
jgi:uncharacterized protein (AIM24 family)